MCATCTQISLIFYPKGKKQCTVQREYCSIWNSYFIQLFIKHFAEVPVVTKKKVLTVQFSTVKKISDLLEPIGSSQTIFCASFWSAQLFCLSGGLKAEQTWSLLVKWHHSFTLPDTTVLIRTGELYTKISNMNSTPNDMAHLHLNTIICI